VEEEQLAEIAAGTAALLRTFQWHGGHADVWKVFRDAEAFERVVTGMVAPFRTESITAVAGIESRGFLLGGAAAIQLGVGFIAIRKAGSLFPGDKARLTTARDCRGHDHELLIQRDSVQGGDRVLLVDDWAETGSQARTVHQLVRSCGAELVGTTLMIDQLDEATSTELMKVASSAFHRPASGGLICRSTHRVASTPRFRPTLTVHFIGRVMCENALADGLQREVPESR
jgi:adenine phosphoribosyltransferase